MQQPLKPSPMNELKVLRHIIICRFRHNLYKYASMHMIQTEAKAYNSAALCKICSNLISLEIILQNLFRRHIVIHI